MEESCRTYHTAQSIPSVKQAVSPNFSGTSTNHHEESTFFARESSRESDRSVPDEPRDQHEIPESAPISPRYQPTALSYGSLPGLIPASCPSETTLNPRCPSLYMEVLSIDQQPCVLQTELDHLGPPKKHFMRLFCCDSSCHENEDTVMQSLWRFLKYINDIID